MPLTGGVVGVAVGTGAWVAGAWVAAGWVGGAEVAVAIAVALGGMVAVAVAAVRVAAGEGVEAAGIGVNPTWLRGVDTAVLSAVVRGVGVGSESFEPPPQDADTTASNPRAMKGNKRRTCSPRYVNVDVECWTWVRTQGWPSLARWPPFGNSGRVRYFRVVAKATPVAAKARPTAPKTIQRPSMPD